VYTHIYIEMYQNSWVFPEIPGNTPRSATDYDFLDQRSGSHLPSRYVLTIQAPPDSGDAAFNYRTMCCRAANPPIS